MNRKLNQKGFSPLIVVVVLVMLLVLGGVGYYIWQRGDSKTPSSTSSEPTTITEQEPTTTKKKDPTENGKYFVIEEWNVRFPVPDELQNDIEYGMFTWNEGGQAAYFTSIKLAAKSTYTCTLDASEESYGSGESGGVIAISRSVDTPEPLDERSFKVDDYWYSVESGNGGACYEGDTGAETGRVKSLLHKAFKDLETIQ